MARVMDLRVKHGCTLQSGKIFAVNEVVPANITYEQLMAGIDDDIYTLVSLTGKTYRGQIRDRAGATLRADLVPLVENDILSFSVPASVVVTWPNESNTFFYDLFETDTVSGIVTLKAEGKVELIPSITQEE